MAKKKNATESASATGTLVPTAPTLAAAAGPRGPTPAELKIEELYRTLDSNFDRIYQRCTTDAQRRQFRDDYVAARDAWWDMEVRVFKRNDPVADGILRDLDAETTKVKEALEQLKGIVATLKAISAAVRLAATVVQVASVA